MQETKKSKMDTSKAIVIRPKIRLAIFWLVFYGFWLIVGLASLYGLFLQQGPDLFLLVYMAFLAIAAFEVRKYTVLLLNPKEHSLHIGPEGVFFRKASARLLPWDEVGKISTLSQFGKKLVKIQRPDTTPGAAVNPSLASRLRKLAKDTYARSYLIDASRLSLPADELAETIRAFAKAHNSTTARD